MKTSMPLVATVITGSCIALALFMTQSTPAANHAATNSPQPSTQRPTAAKLACQFEEGARRAYQVRSLAGMGGVVDRFEGQLHVEVIEAKAQGALLKAAFTQVQLAQSLTQEQERAEATTLEAAPFLIQTDSSCRLLELGFAPGLGVADRQLISTIMRAYEFALPQDAQQRWEAEQRDGSGDYLARYHAEPTTQGVKITRQKQHNHQRADQSGGFGVELKLINAQAVAMFDPTSGAFTQVQGQELVHLKLPGSPRHELTHTFSMVRQDSLFTSPSALAQADADFRDAFGLERAQDQETSTEFAKMSLAQAQARFTSIFEERGKDGVLPAARFLSKWLKAHPELAAQLLELLRQDQLPSQTHAALFLAFELAGDDASRQVLTTALQDPALSELNRARAATALADHGEPSLEAAKTLLKRAKEDQSSMVKNVSRLGLGTMAGRAQGELREELNLMLSSELDAASSREEVVASLSAIGNSADSSFAPKLAEHLQDAEPSVRAHAARALGKMPNAQAREAIVSQLNEEEDAQVVASLLRGVQAQDKAQPTTLSAAEITLAARLLEHPEYGVRALAIEWLGQAASQPQAQQLLIARFPKEPAPRLKQLIGKYVSATQLRAARVN